MVHIINVSDKSNHSRLLEFEVGCRRPGWGLLLGWTGPIVWGRGWRVDVLLVPVCHREELVVRVVSPSGPTFPGLPLQRRISE